MKEISIKSRDRGRDFFRPTTVEFIFNAKAGNTSTEVAHVLRQTRLKPPADVLDLACGVGTHLRALAARGFAVTGLDYSKGYLRAARIATKIAGLPVRFVHGDARNLKPHFEPNSFDLVLFLFNSFGCFDKRSDDVKVLRAVNRVLRPGCWLIINTLNEGGVLQRLKEPISRARYEPLPNVLLIDEALYNPDARKTTYRSTIAHFRDAEPRLFREDFRQNVYSHIELKELLRRAGFRVEKTWGVLAGGAFDPKKSWHQTIAARKCD
jgi:SAM-dependent methyltransferase